MRNAFCCLLLFFSQWAYTLPPQVETALTQAQAWRQHGQLSKGLQLLEQQLTQAETAPAQAALYSALSEFYLLQRQTERALDYAQQSLTLAERSADPRLQAQALNHWGNALAQQQAYHQALTQYQTAIRHAQAAQADALLASLLLNQLHVLQILQQPLTARLQDAFQHLQQLPDTADTALHLISLAHYKILPLAQRYQLLRRAMRLSKAVQQDRVYAFALGHLAELYQATQQLDEAERLTQQAIFYAQTWPDQLYRWQGQLAHLRQQQGDTAAAIRHYQYALDTLERVRPVLYHSVSPQAFNDSIAPLYFNLLDLLLATAQPLSHIAQQPLLQQAQQVLERYRSIELENFYQDACVTLQEQQQRSLTQSLAPHTAVFYPILLPERTVLLVQIEQQLYQVVQAQRFARDLTALVQRWLTQRLTARLGQQLYQWLIAPITPLLQQHQVQTLVIVPQGALLRLPFAALLSPSQEYLMQQYALVITPSLRLTAPVGSDLTTRPLQVLAGGISEAVQTFPPLPAVREELAMLHELFGGPQPLSNASFVVERLQQRLRAQPYQVIHLATHGQFGSQPQESFLLTYTGRLTLDALERFVRISRFRQQPVELLTLSACETAVSPLDPETAARAALGLAGIAVKAGARSVLASLWQIEDQATLQFMQLFYQNLSHASSRVEAVQQAQQAMLDTPFGHPWYWAAFVLIGSWL